MSKDKKKKKKDKKDGKAKGSPSLTSATKSLKAIAENPLVADVVAATLVSMAAALRDSNKARQIAGQASEEIRDMAKKSSDRGSAMWQLALDVGRRTLESIAEEPAKGRKK